MLLGYADIEISAVRLLDSDRGIQPDIRGDEGTLEDHSLIVDITSHKLESPWEYCPHAGRGAEFIHTVVVDVVCCLCCVRREITTAG